MIKYNLKCKNKHEFESWFSDSKEFEKLKNSKIIECIFCKTKSIEKSIMSPRISNKDIDEKNINTDKDIKKVKNELLKIQKFVEKNFEYVEKNFANKVREVYYDKKSKKNIYGTTTKAEREELQEEGIELVSLPWIEKDN